MRTHRVLGAAAVAAILLLPAACPVAARDDAAFTLSRLSVADKLLDVRAEDLDGDGLCDIVITHRKGLPPDETRWISVFWQDAEGGFATAADHSWPVDTAAVLLDIGDFDNDGGREIVYATPSEIRCYRLAGRRYDETPVTLFETGGIAVFPPESRLPVVDFVRDWNGDGREEIAVFDFGGLRLHAADTSGRWVATDTLRIDISTVVYTRDSGSLDGEVTLGVSARYAFPDIRVEDVDADGRADLLTIDDDEVAAYLLGANGRFAAVPSWRRRFDVRTKKEKIEGIAEVSTVVRDLDGDGYVDVVVTKQTAKGLSNFRGVINVYRGGPAGFAEAPGQVIVSEGTASATAMIRDVNGDGRLDLVLPSVKISVSSIIRFLLTRSVPIAFNIFLLGENDRFSDRPDFTKEVKFKIDFSGDSDTQAMDLDGDFDGDRRKDFVFATGENELSIYLGLEDGGDRLFSKKPVARIEADAYGELDTRDLNGDGYSDMIIHYPQSRERRGMVQVLINRRTLR
ncbi:MAG: VCBS repeat-containing protein [Candidatus Krumholzibacteriota bacterium]|nr:VCBS repeat-containing protein [Candidatus Krumholzibacteriota bacterium]